MTRPKTDRPAPSLAAFGLCVLAVLAFFIGCVCVSNAALHHFPLWLCADQYVAADLEVTRFDPRRGRRSSLTIEGVIHPGGERLWTSTRDVAISQFVDPNERAVRRVPLRGEIEGRRLAVWYWPEHARVIRWWHPPTVIMPGATAEAGGAVVRTALLGVAFGAVAVFCFRRFWRHVKAVFPPEPARPATRPWFGIALVLLYVGVLGLVAYILSL